MCFGTESVLMTDKIEVQFFVNDQEVAAQVSPDLSLMIFLRDYMNLTGTKNGCATGHCGACTVIIDGKATRSCLFKMKRIKADTKVETIEGLAKDGKLHPIQRAFVENGAVQCGFCTPGMIMAAKALLQVNPDPTDEEIKTALTKNRNICRCTGYVNIIKSIRKAAEMIAAGEGHAELEPEGDRVRSTQLYRDAIDKVTGATEYGADIKMDGMLYGKLLWSEHPHAEIISIDTSEAEKVPGVVGVFTARDIPGTNKIGNLLRDQPTMADKKVHYIGDSLASVYAESLDAAEEAIKKIHVKYKVLPGVFSPEEAARPDAPIVQDGRESNLCHQTLIERGDVEKAFEQCEVIVERSYTTPFLEHGFMEPESGVCFKGSDDGITLLSHTQTVFDVRSWIVENLEVPEEKVRVVQIPQGGSFGGKEDPIFEVHLALGALRTGRPCKIVLTREESLRVHVKRHPSWMTFKTGADKDGNMLAIKADITTDTGCYSGLGIDILENMAVFAAGPYYVPNLYLEGHAWFTNNVLAGAMRGFGVNQISFALEQNLDEMARALNIDPFVIRAQNGLRPGQPTASDHVLEEGMAGIVETIEAARDSFAENKDRLIGKKSEGNKRIGVGVACAVKNVGFGHGAPESAGSILELDKDGNFTLLVSHHEYGQGGHAGEIQLAANELGVPIDQIAIVGPDTARTIPTGPTTASRQTFLTGKATVMVSQALKEDLFSRAAEILDSPPEGLKFQDDCIVDSAGERVELSELGEKFVYQKTYTPPPTAPLLEGEASQYGKPGFESRMTHYAYIYNTQVAVVEVDMDSGDVGVLGIISANDLGKVINPEVVDGQVHGGVLQGIGYALSEEFVIERGVNTTDTLRKCGILTADKTAEIIPVNVEVTHPFGPQGMKGFAEGPSMATCPAILNAIYDALGERITSLPAKKEKVMAAIQGHQG
jgi:aldehyde oxidoreductase